MKIIAYDIDNDYTVSSDEEGAVFTFKKGRLIVDYVREKNFNNDGIGIDAPVQLHSDNLEIISINGRPVTSFELASDSKPALLSPDFNIGKYADNLMDKIFGNVKTAAV